MKYVDGRSTRTVGVIFSAAVALMTSPAAASPAAISPSERSWEVRVGEEAYAKYAEQGEIVPRQSLLYGILDPVARAVARVADRQYYTRFNFILLNEAQPNALSMPGGNVYVTTAMLSYLRNRDELAGVLCHEVNHDIHHDMYNVNQAIERGERPISYERAVEANADRAGAYTCAKAGFNPWGMVWNMRLRRESGESPQMSPTADHPSDDQRLADLTALLRSDPATFGKFRDDIALASPLRSTRVYAQSGYNGDRPVSYPSQYQAQYPGQYQAQYPSQYQPQNSPPMAPYPPPPLPACYPGC